MNKIGDNIKILYLILFYSFLSFISYYPGLSYSIFLPFTIYFLGIINSFVSFLSTIDRCCIYYYIYLINLYVLFLN